MIIDRFYKLLFDVVTDCSTKSVFGKTGVFYRGAMFAQFDKDKIYIRGGNQLDKKLRDMGCSTYTHVKKQSASNMNYYDISKQIEDDPLGVKELVVDAYHLAYDEQLERDSSKLNQIRNLPNLSHAIERMLKKHCEIESVDALVDRGAASCYVQLHEFYVSVKESYELLWRLHGAIHHLHWELISEEDKKELIGECNKLLWHKID